MRLAIFFILAGISIVPIAFSIKKTEETSENEGLLGLGRIGEIFSISSKLVTCLLQISAAGVGNPSQSQCLTTLLSQLPGLPELPSTEIITQMFGALMGANQVSQPVGIFNCKGLAIVVGSSSPIDQLIGQVGLEVFNGDAICQNICNKPGTCKETQSSGVVKIKRDVDVVPNNETTTLENGAVAKLAIPGLPFSTGLSIINHNFHCQCDTCDGIDTCQEGQNPPLAPEAQAASPMTCSRLSANSKACPSVCEEGEKTLLCTQFAQLPVGVPGAPLNVLVITCACCK